MKKKKYLPLYEAWMKNGKYLPWNSGLCMEFFYEFANPKQLLITDTLEYAELMRFQPQYPLDENDWHKAHYHWGNSSEDFMEGDGEFNEFRQNVMLFLAAMNEEL
jgi:hypothetical protein